MLVPLETASLLGFPTSHARARNWALRTRSHSRGVSGTLFARLGTCDRAKRVQEDSEKPVIRAGHLPSASWVTGDASAGPPRARVECQETSPPARGPTGTLGCQAGAHTPGSGSEQEARLDPSGAPDQALARRSVGDRGRVVAAPAVVAAQKLDDEEARQRVRDWKARWDAIPKGWKEQPIEAQRRPIIPGYPEPEWSELRRTADEAQERLGVVLRELFASSK